MPHQPKPLKRACKTQPTVHLELEAEFVIKAPSRLVGGPLPRSTKTLPTVRLELDSLQATAGAPPDAIRKLLLLLRECHSGLANEICPNHPKSILTKAEDIQRNLSDWYGCVAGLEKTDQLFVRQSVGESDCLLPLHRALLDTERDLRPLVAIGNPSHDLAGQHRKILLEHIINASAALKGLIADIPAIIGSIDIVMGEIDR